MWYINLKYRNLPLDTVDEAETMKEAMYLLREYQFSAKNDRNSQYMVSSKCTKDWREK